MKKNYRWNKRCKVCKEFICRNKKHICGRVPKRKNGLYHCGKCKQYLPKLLFNRDHTKKHGIMCICKKCRKPFNKRHNENLLKKRRIEKLKYLVEVLKKSSKRWKLKPLQKKN